MMTNKKIMMLATTDNMIWQFLLPHIKYLQDAGNMVECVCAKTGFWFDELKNKLLEALGGSDNIISSNVEMSRVTIEVNDIELINGEALKEIGASGVLLVGNKVKCSFNENAKEVQKLLEK